MRRNLWFLCCVLVLAACGREPGQCFTWIDLDQFTREGGHLRIADRVKREKLFLESALRLKAMTRPERDSVMRAARRPLCPTWAQLGRIDSVDRPKLVSVPNS